MQHPSVRRRPIVQAGTPLLEKLDNRRDIVATSRNSALVKLPHADVAFFRGLASGDQPLIQRAADALSHGYTVAFASAVGFLLAALVITITTLNASPQQRTEDAAPVHIG